MSCPSCGCKETYQFNSEEDFAGDDERLERCAACGAVFDIEDHADEDEEGPEVCRSCNGTGIEGINRGEGLMPRCDTCKGTGEIGRNKEQGDGGGV